MFTMAALRYVWPQLRVVTAGYPVTQQEFTEAEAEAAPELQTGLKERGVPMEPQVRD